MSRVLRRLAKEPLFTVSVVLLLALGLGLNGVVFTFFDTLVLRPVPSVLEPDRVAAVFSQDEGSRQHLPISFLDYRDYQEHALSFQSLAARRLISVSCLTDGLAEQVAGEMVSASYFATLGLRPALGRFFLPEEDRVPGEAPVAVVSHDFWRERLGGDPRAVGRVLRINGRPFQVVGVAPEGYHGPDSFTGARIWVPLSEVETVTGDAKLFETRSRRSLLLLGRLAPEVTLEQAAHEMSALAARLAQSHPESNRGQTMALFPLPEVKIFPSQRGGFVQAGFFLLSLTGVLLLAACCNVANLMLARAVARQKDWAVLVSLGARTRVIVRELLVEGLLISLLGGAVSLLVLAAGVRALWALRPWYLEKIPLDLSLDARVLVFVAGMALATGVLFSLAPVVYARRTALAPLLKGAGHGIAGAGLGLRAMGLFVALQVSLAMFSLGCAGFCLGSYLTARTFDPGFAARDVLMLSFDPRTLGYDEIRGRKLQEELVRSAGRLPGVTSVALSENRLLGGFRLFREVHPPGRAGASPVLAGSSIVAPAYFATAGVPLVRGRAFAATDRAGAPGVAIVNATLAERLFPGEDAVGRRVRLDAEESPVEIVGVARTVAYRSPGEKPQPFLYLPLTQRYAPAMTLLVRGSGAVGLAPAARETFREIDPQLPVFQVQTVRDALTESLWEERTGAVLLGGFGILALLLAVVGVYSIAAYSMARRRSEIALRLALGADRSGIVRLMLRQGLRLVAIGIVLGGLVTFAVLGWASSLFDAGPGARPAAMLVSALILIAIGVMANVVPTLRAARLAAPGLAVR